MRNLVISERFTNRNLTTERYFNDVNKHERMTVEEEYETAVLASEGDPKAIEKLVTSNLRFVISVAKQYSRNPEVLNELVSQGNIGLIDAAKTFDPTRGFKFISYAVWHIRKEILKYLTENSRTVRVPSNVGVELNRVKKVEAVLSTKLGREPLIEEIVEALKKLGFETDEQRIKMQQTAMEPIVPFEVMSTGDEVWSPSDWMSSSNKASDLVDREDVKIVLRVLLDKLKPYEREVIMRYHGMISGEPEPFWKISETHGKTVEWARWNYTSGLRRIKKLMAKNKSLVEL